MQGNYGDTTFEDKVLTICSGRDYVNINYHHVVCPDNKTAEVSCSFLVDLLNNEFYGSPSYVRFLQVGVNQRWMQTLFLRCFQRHYSTKNEPILYLCRVWCRGLISQECNIMEHVSLEKKVRGKVPY